jgi:S-adenosylmethionine hydrolase
VPLNLGSQPITVPFVKTFGDVPLRKPLLYIDSRGHVGLAVNQDSFAARYGIKPPVAISIPRKKP